MNHWIQRVSGCTIPWIVKQCFFLLKLWQKSLGISWFSKVTLCPPDNKNFSYRSHHYLCTKTVPNIHFPKVSFSQRRGLACPWSQGHFLRINWIYIYIYLHMWFKFQVQFNSIKPKHTLTWNPLTFIKPSWYTNVWQVRSTYPSWTCSGVQVLIMKETDEEGMVSSPNNVPPV